jgi:hypothetical protein
VQSRGGAFVPAGEQGGALGGALGVGGDGCGSADGGEPGQGTDGGGDSALPVGDDGDGELLPGDGAQQFPGARSLMVQGHPGAGVGSLMGAAWAQPDAVLPRRRRAARRP